MAKKDLITKLNKQLIQLEIHIKALENKKASKFLYATERKALEELREQKFELKEEIKKAEEDLNIDE